MARTRETRIAYDEREKETGFGIRYEPQPDGGVRIDAVAADETLSVPLPRERVDEAHILYAEVTELLDARAKAGQAHAEVRAAIEQLFGLFRGEQPPAPAPVAHVSTQAPGDYAPNPGKALAIEVDGVSYLRLPIKTRIITTRDTDILPLVETYVRPHVQEGDTLYVSEKALTITQGRIVSMSDIHPTRLARFLSQKVGNYYGTDAFRGFGHGTAIAMQAFIDEAGVPRVLFAAVVSALTRPLGIRGLFYRLCGVRAKSIDCPMSFLILAYAHAVKLAPDDPSAAAERIKQALGVETVILDANYRGAFSLGKSSGAPSEAAIGQLFRDNPLGQSDEMTPFCLVRQEGSKKG